MWKGILNFVLKKLILITLIFFGCSLQGKDYPFEIAEQRESVTSSNDAVLVASVRKHAHKISGSPKDYDPLMEMIGDARFVLLGESTHGTHEFYRERARITQRLIEEKGFDAVVIEADWTDAFRISEFVRGKSIDKTAERALSGFERFPQWMWRNTDFRNMVVAIRSINDARSSETGKVGIFGMDVYGHDESIDAVLKYLKRVDPAAATRARKRYSCFNLYRDPAAYGAAVAENKHRSCEKQAVEQFHEMETRYNFWLKSPNKERNDELFSAYQNSRVVKNGEAYFRLSYKPNFSTWNLRDSHMADTIHALAQYFEVIGNSKSKIVVWAHNTHQGDAMMTEMGEAGELNVGHLMRKQHDGNTILVGFTTFTGEVRAASEWGDSGKRMKVRPALEGSYSNLFHQTTLGNFLLIFRGNESISQELLGPRLERAIGVVYKPQTERQSHYFEARISKQFDAVIHFDSTAAVNN